MNPASERFEKSFMVHLINIFYGDFQLFLLCFAHASSCLLSGPHPIHKERLSQDKLGVSQIIKQPNISLPNFTNEIFCCIKMQSRVTY